MKIIWDTQADLVTPNAAIAFGAAAFQLSQRLYNETAQNLKRLQICGTNNILFILGEATMLPWIDGLIYLTNAFNPELFHPCYCIPQFPMDLLAQIIFERTHTKPTVLLNNPDQLLSLINMQIADHDILNHWLTTMGSDHAVT